MSPNVFDVFVQSRTAKEMNECLLDAGGVFSPMPDCTSPGLKERERHSTCKVAVDYYRRPAPAFWFVNETRYVCVSAHTRILRFPY
jgi:hypothetical protein